MNTRIYTVEEYDYPNGRWVKAKCYCPKCFHFNSLPILIISNKNGTISYECIECKYTGSFVSKKDIRNFKIKELLNV